jgi:hypothetical protein
MNILTTIEQLQQLSTATWDGNLISKHERDMLVKNEYAIRASGGYNVITPKGINTLIQLKKLHP